MPESCGHISAIEDVKRVDFLQLYIPVGFAHGFCVLSDVAELEYQCSDIYDPGSERGLLWSDPDLAIAWPVTEPIISERDRRHPRLREIQARVMLPRA